MPEMNGYEVCEQLKKSPELSGAPVIFLSALNAKEDKVKATSFQRGAEIAIVSPGQKVTGGLGMAPAAVTARNRPGRRKHREVHLPGCGRGSIGHARPRLNGDSFSDPS